MLSNFLRKLGLLAITVAVPVCGSAALIPGSRLADWTAGVSVGVTGGIPTRTNIIDATRPPYNADATGANDASGAISRALGAARSGDVVYLPAGTYRCNSALTLPSNVVLRGAGAGTVLKMYSSQVAIQCGTGTEWPWDYSTGGSPIVGGAAQGSASLNLSDASSISVGDIVVISEDNDPALPVIHVDGKKRLRKQKSVVTAKNGSTITISPSLLWTLNSGRAPRARAMQTAVRNAGIEDLAINLSNSSAVFGIWMDQAVGCWIKNVSINAISNYGIYVLDCFRTEIRHCDIRNRKTQGSNGSGLLMERSAACLIEDNIIYDVFPHIEVSFDSSANVIAYNFCEVNDVGGLMGVSIDANHGPHNHFNLYEGNVASKFQSDGYFGSASDDTVARNWFHGTSDTANQFGICIYLNRFSRNYNLVGNVLGQSGKTYVYDNNGQTGSYTNRYIYVLGLPNIGNLAAAGAAQVSLGRIWNDLTTVLSGGGVGSGGFQEIDLDVASTILRKGNWNARDAGVPPAESTSGDAIPASFFRSTKPAWFGTLAWPAFGPDRVSQSYDSIPAGYRYTHGVEAPGVSGGAPLAAPTSLSVHN